jgi:hypothetical protein
VFRACEGPHAAQPENGASLKKFDRAYRPRKKRIAEPRSDRGATAMRNSLRPRKNFPQSDDLPSDPRSFIDSRLDDLGRHVSAFRETRLV